MAVQNKDSYRDNPLLKKVGVEHPYTQEQAEEYAKCASDPVYFAINYIKIVNVDEGLIPFKMWDFQKEMIKIYHENRFSITKCPRQVGKTTTSVAYLLWSTIFTDSQSVAVLANKGSLARDILAKYQLAYENLPMWLQQGVVTWNKGNVELENGSKIIATPNGMNLFYKLWMDAIGKKNGYKPFEIHWSMVPGRTEQWKEETIRNTSLRQFQQEFETEFLGSSNTLISGYKLAQLRYMDAIAEHDMMKIYEQPIKTDGIKYVKDRLYCLMVDVSEGKNLDSSAFSVIDISELPYKQVATYKSSSITPLLFPTVIYNAARYYNDAYVLIEINNTPQIADTLHADLEYENLWKVFTGNKKPQQLSAGFARGVQLGLKMSPQVKKIGTSNLKTLIEGDKLLINDFATYSELTTFVETKNTFAAEQGANDDLVMGLVMFGWVTTQPYFKEIVAHDLRKQVQLENMNQFDDETVVEPIMDDGLRHDLELIDGDLWEVADGSPVYSKFMRDSINRM